MLTLRPTDRLGGRLHCDAFAAHRGVRAAPVSALRWPKQQQKQETLPPVATAPQPTSTQAQPPARGRPNGRQRRRKARPAGSPWQPQKRVMENVVILKRGEQIAPEVTAALTVARAEKAEPVAASDQRGSQAEKTDTGPTAEQCGAQAKAEPVPAADQCGAQGEKAEAVAAENQCGAPAKKAEVVAAADQLSTSAKKAEAAPVGYSGLSFVVSPEPSELPIPVFLLKPRRGRTAACV